MTVYSACRQGRQSGKPGDSTVLHHAGLGSQHTQHLLTGHARFTLSPHLSLDQDQN